jgi:hypothetical protein
MSEHEKLPQHGETAGGSDRSFGLVFAVVFLFLGSISLLDGGDVVYWPILVAAGFLVFALVYPQALGPLNRLWTKFGLLLGSVVNPLVLAIIFLVVLTPIALGMRLAGKDPLRLKLDRRAKTYWIDRSPPGPAPQSMKQQF